MASLTPEMRWVGHAEYIVQYFAFELEKDIVHNVQNSLIIVEEEEVGGWRLKVGGWRLEVGGWRLKVEGWRLKVEGWKVGLEKG